MRGLQKYIDRGWPIHDLGPREQRRLSCPMRKARHTNDSFCWRIKFGLRGRGCKTLTRFDQRSAPIWWSMPAAQENWVNWEIPADSTPDHNLPPYKYHGRVHDYPIRAHGFLHLRHVKTQQALSLLPISSAVHLVNGTKDHLWCTCREGRELDEDSALDCELRDAQRVLKENGLWTTDEAQRIRGFWSILNVGVV
ncbi:hypothetical protein LTR62_003987 [Meristemomyces frigidus]|uniref:Uncharacterized protein n=1 Tax=Meristemomyces frigidus TaxID=1508187 RepID=A0AAN7TNH7_9PEZI|nr:hypothetical protein LTR62_003987 [Meristemomyces frigidus]